MGCVGEREAGAVGEFLPGLGFGDFGGEDSGAGGVVICYEAVDQGELVIFEGLGHFCWL